MLDPLDALPYELWTVCIAFAIDGQEVGPLPFLAVSRRWERLLLETPTLWTQVYIQNGEDEIARISTFLHLSTGSSLHVEIMMPLPDMDCLQPIATHISRVATISIRPPSLSYRDTSLHMDQWEKAAACVLAKLSNGIVPSDVKQTSCLGVSLRQDYPLYNCVFLMKFEMGPAMAKADQPDSSIGTESPEAAWEDHIKMYASAAHWQHNRSVAE